MSFFSSLNLRRISFIAIAAIASTFSCSLALAQAPAVATGDTRTVTEPTFPALCTAQGPLLSLFHDVNNDVPVSYETANGTASDTARIQAAINACTSSGATKSVELSMDANGNNAFLTGPLTLPAGVTLLVDSGVTLYFSRNAQDYDKTPGTHTCGTVANASQTSSCKNLISVTGSNTGIMGYGTLDGRGGDVVLNSFVTAGSPIPQVNPTWWDIANDYVSPTSQQNPRFIQTTNASNFTLYKFKIKNAPEFHICISGGNGVTIWGIKIITPYTSHNTDGIDPSGVTNLTITHMAGSDGDDNVALGANMNNVTVSHNRFFAGHGESIGSITTNGLANVLFDSNMNYGDADVDGSNSTAVRIKSANDRGGNVHNIQYSNSCFANHGTQMQFNTLYNTTAGTATPNFNNILLQNLRFVSGVTAPGVTNPVATGSLAMQGALNGTTNNPLTITLDNVTMDTAPTTTSPNTQSDIFNAQITLGPGGVSTTLATPIQAANGLNSNIVTGNSTGPLSPPVCTFTFLTPEITGTTAQTQTLTTGQNATAVVILSPAEVLPGMPYPTGTITITDENSATVATATLPGTGDTIFVTIPNPPAGTHTYSAAFGGNTVYPAITAANWGSTYSVTVNPGTLTATGIGVTGVPASSSFGTPFTATATLTGTGTPTGSINFIVNGAIYSTSALSGKSASATFNLPFGSYTFSAAYNGDASNAAIASTPTALTVGAATTTTTLGTSSTSTTVGTPVTLTATIASVAGTPTGTVAFSYNTVAVPTPVTLGNATLVNGVANFSAFLPFGADNVIATYTASGSFATSTSSATTLTVTVGAAPPVPDATLPIAIPYNITTIAGGGTTTPASGAACPSPSAAGSKSTDLLADGCLGSSIAIVGTTTIDLRTVTADPFGNVYFTDGTNNAIRKVAPNGIISDFIGLGLVTPVCAPTAVLNCNPLAIKFTSKPRGVYADALGNVFVASTSSNQVVEYKVSDGLVHLIAGNGTAGNSNGTSALTAMLSGPRAVATDGAGNVYIADTTNNIIREVVAATGAITTVAGTGLTTPSTGENLPGANVPATSANLATSQGLAIDTSNNVYIATASGADAICVTCAPGPSPLFSLLTALGYTNIQNGNIYTVAGGGASSRVPGLATTLRISSQRVALDPNGNLYISDAGTGTANVGDALIWFEDGRTGYARPIAGNVAAVATVAGATCTGGTATNTLGDGCVGTQALLGDNAGGSSAAGFGVGIDVQGNVYISDTMNLRIRKLSNNLNFGSSPVGTPVTKNIQIHYLPGDAPVTVTPGTTEFSMGTPVCSTAPDNTTDCVYPATFTPAIAGLRQVPLSITTVLGNPGTLALSGVGTGAGATLDPANQILFGQSISPNAIATDNAGNVYVADSISKNVLKFPKSATTLGTGAVGTVLQAFTNPVAVAVDSLGNVFVADATTGFVTEITPAGVTKTLSTLFTTPDGLAVDALNNLYVSDTSAKTVTKIGSNLISAKIIGAATTTPLGLKAPAGLAVDANGNVYVADTGAVVRLDNAAASTTPAGNVNLAAITSVTTAATSPKAVAVDAAGNLLIADSSSNQIIAVPAVAPTAIITVATAIPGNSLALDSVGNVYTNSGANQVLELQRTIGSASYNGFGSASNSFNLLSTGNAAATLTLVDPDKIDFSLVLATPVPASCTGTLATTIVIASGGLCNLTAGFTPAVDQNFTNTISFTGAANGTPTITQAGTDAPFASTTTLGAFTPSSPLLGQAVTLTATVASLAGQPTGTVSFAVDGTVITPASTVNATTGVATATAPVSSLGVGSHTITAVFTSNSAFTPSSLNFANSTATSIQVVVGKGTENATVAVLNNPSIYNKANSATLTLNVLSGTPTGTVQFSIDGTVFGSPVTIASSAATLTLPSLTAGNHTVSGAYSGDSNFSPVSASAITFTVSKANTATVFALAAPVPAPTGTGVNMTFTATVSNATSGSSGTPTGSVQFLDTGIALGTAPIVGSTATLTTSFSTAATHNVAAVYGGDGNFNPSFSNALTESLATPGYSTSVNPSTLTIARGNSGTATFTFTPVGNYQGTLTLGCSGLPAFVTCVFVPPTVTFTGDNSVQTSQLTVYTNGNTAPAPRNGSLWWPAVLLVCFVAFRRRKLSGMLRPLVMLVIAAFAFSAISGCGGNNGTLTPTGTSTATISIVAIGSGGSPSSAQNVALTIVITQ